MLERPRDICAFRRASVADEMLAASEVLLACLSVQSAVYWMTHDRSELCVSKIHAAGTLCLCNSAGAETSHCVSGPESVCAKLQPTNKVRTSRDSRS